MAFGQTQSRSQQFNQNIDKLLQYLMQTNLIEKRQAGSMEYLTEQQRGWQDLQKTQAKDSRSLLMDKYIMELSRDETVRRLQATIFWKEHNGQDATAEKEQLRQAAYDLTTAGAGALKGRFGPEMMKAIPNLTDEAFRILVGQAGASARQGEHIERVDEPSRKLREREVELEKSGQEIRRGELEHKRAAENIPERTTELIRFVRDIESYLRGQGVQPEDSSQIMAMFSTGKKLDPLSPANMGQALQWLGEIRLGLIDGKDLSNAERRFLATVRNAAKIEGIPQAAEGATGAPTAAVPGEGLVSPYTGMTGPEGAQVNTAIDQKVNEGLYQQLFQAFKMRGFSDENAAMHARKLLDSLK